MGEANPNAIAVIEQFVGRPLRYGETPEGQQCLHIGDKVMVAYGLGLWSDPSAYLHDDGSLTVCWAGQMVRLFPEFPK